MSTICQSLQGVFQDGSWVSRRKAWADEATSRSAGDRIPTIFVTGYVTEWIAAQGADAGAFDIVELPFSAEVLVERCKLPIALTRRGGHPARSDDIARGGEVVRLTRRRPDAAVLNPQPTEAAVEPDVLCRLEGWTQWRAYRVEEDSRSNASRHTRPYAPKSADPGSCAQDVRSRPHRAPILH
jgi:hypothetical protein